MKKILVFAATALVAMSMISCGGDRLAARHEVVLADTTGTILPFIKNFDEENFCASAKKLMPSGKLVDSLSYLVGINLAFQTSYSLKGLDLKRCFKAADDFKKVGFEAFGKAVKCNFQGEDFDAIADKFEINPNMLNKAATKLSRLPDSLEVPAGLRDTVSYLFGINIGYQVAANKLNDKVLRNSMEHFVEVDTEHKFMDFIHSNFTDSTYAEFAKKFKIAPDMIQTVGEHYGEAQNEAYMKNVEIQSKLFIEEAAKVADVKKVDVTYTETVDSTEVTKSYPIYYHFTKLADVDSPKVEIGDSVTVNYLGRHIDYRQFDKGSFPVDGVAYDGKLIRGFTAALLLLREGDEIEAVLPSELAYGEHGSRGIYPHETLIFKMSVSDLRKAAPAPAEAEEPAATPAE